MLKIGDFSRLAHVTVKTLHHYEQMGLLRPAWVNRFNGYRYYSVQQLPRLNRILALKDLGFSLDQVAALLNTDLGPQELSAMLRGKQLELEQRLAQEQHRLVLVAARLQQIEREGSLPAADVVLKRVEALPVALARVSAAREDQLVEQARRTCQSVRRWLGQQNIRAAATWLTLHPAADYREHGVQAEAAVVVDARAVEVYRRQPDDPAVLCWLPEAAEMACMVVNDSLADRLQAHADLFGWLERNGYQVSGALRQVYLEPGGAGETSMVEMQSPVQPLGASSFSVSHPQDKKEQKMEYKLVDQPAFTVVGVLYQGKNQNHEINRLWDVFNRRAREIQDTLDGPAYGLCRIPAGLPEGEFEYVAGFPVSSTAHVPAGMVARSLPAMKCARFEHRGLLTSLGDTYNHIYQVALPQAGLQPLEPGLDFESYDEDFKIDSPDSVMYIWVPVK